MWMGKGVIVAILSGVLVPISALADSPQERTAEALRTAAKQYHLAGDYRRCAESFLESNRLVPIPNNLFNAGLCFQKAGNFSAALGAFEGYIAAVPHGDRIAEAQTRIDLLRLQAKAKRPNPEPVAPTPIGTNPPESTVAESQETLPSPAMPAPTAAESQLQAVATESAPATTVVVDSKATSGSSSMSPMRRYAWISLGAGAVGLLGVASFDQLAKSAVDTKNEEPKTENADRVERYELLVNSSLVLAGVGVVAGGALYLVSMGDDDTDDAQAYNFGVVPTKGGVAASFDMRF